MTLEKICIFFNCYDDTEEEQVELSKTSRNMMRKVGLLVNNANTKMYIKIMPIILFYNMIHFGQIGHIIHYLSNNPFSFFDVADDISVILTCNTINFVNVTLLKISPYLNKICKELGDFTHPDMKRARGIVALDRLFSKCAKALIGVFFVAGLFTFVLYVMEKCEPDEVSTCGFIFIPYLPFIDIYNKPWRQITLICQVLSPYTCGAISLINVSQYMFINEVIIMRFDHLGRLVDRIPKIKPKERRTLIGRIVRYHNYLIGINAYVNDGLSIAYACHLCVTPLNMSVIAFQLIGKEIMLSSIVHIASYIFIVTITCVSGERLTTYTDNLYNKVFYAMPFDDLKTMKSMQILLMRAQKPLRVEAGGIAGVNNVMMVNLYQTVWSVLTLLIKTK